MSYRRKETNETQVKDVDWTVHEENFRGLNAGVDQLLDLFGGSANGPIHRSKVDLLDLAPLLAKICWLDLVFDAQRTVVDAIVRFQGEEHVAFFGEHTHQSVTTLATSNATDRVLDGSQRACDLEHPVVCVSDGAVISGGTLHADILIIPLCEDDGVVTGALTYMDIQYR